MLELITESERPLQVLAGIAVVFLICYCVLKSIYNVYFHPLSHIPGPRLAAVGSFYEFWYDVIKDGTYLWKIEEMHEKYGEYPDLG